MAAATTALRLCARAIARPRPTPTLRARPFVPHRTLAGTAFRWRPANTPDEGDEATLGHEAESDYDFVESMLADLPPEERTPQLMQEMRDLELKLADQERTMNKSLDEESMTLFKEPKPLRDSFWFDEDDDDTMTHDVVGEDFDEDDIPTVAHGKLDELREHRHYARIIAWEMPMLSKLAKPFEPPKNDEPLRFRYTTYLGEYHPAQRKVVVTFCPSDLGLTAEQELKLKKLVGPRYNPEKDMVKMSCESYDHQAQNKRYLSDQIDKLLASAKDSTDTFADIPLDLRHHPIKQKPKFPTEWRLTEARRKELDELRAQSVARDVKRGDEGKLVDGSVMLKQMLQEPAPEPEAAGGRGPAREKVPVRVGARKR